MSEALATQSSKELEKLAANVAAAQELEDVDQVVQTPLLKLAQGLTQEVQDGEAEPGEFINTLTAEPLGDTVEFVLSYYHKGRFASDQDSGRAYTAFSQEIPAHWADLVGEEWVGKPFTEYPEAEEEFRAACNRKERDWGHGPLVSTTHNFTGLVLTDDGPQPVRLSLKRTEKGAWIKLNTLRKSRLLGQNAWDKIVTLSTTKKKFGRNESWIINPNSIRPGRETSPEERELALLLAQAVSQGRIDATGDEPEQIAEPDAKGGLAV